MNRLRGKLPLLVIAATALALRLRNAWTVLETLSRTTLPDDSFYDFAIARNLALGFPPSIDGLHATNGYHPLWVAILTVIYRFSPANDLRTPVHVALTLGALLDVVALVLLHRIARRLRLDVGADFAALVFALSAGAIVNATCGLETPLALVLLLAVADRQLAMPDEPRDGTLFVFGSLVGLAVLARTDAVVPCAVMSLCVIARRRSHARAFTIVALPAAICVAAWLLFSYRTTGTTVQSSAVALALVADRMPAIWGFAHAPLSLRIERILASCGETYAMIAAFTGIGRLGLAFVIGAGCAAFGFARGARGTLARRQLARIAPLVVGLLVLLFLHAAVRKVFRPWYTAPYVALAALTAGYAVDHLARLARTRFVAAAAACIAVVTLAAYGRSWQREGIYGGGDYRAIAPSPGMYEGHTDCGAVAYFSRRGVVNLDGVVNSTAIEGLRDGRLLDYLRREKFTRVYATDHYHDALFFGRRYRESLRGVDVDPRAVVLATPAEKDALVTLGRDPISLGGRKGRELLDDGWLWITEPRERGFAISIGPRSELLVYLPAPLPSAASRIEISVRATIGDKQRIEAHVDEAPVVTFEATPTPKWMSLPLEGLSPGRHHVVLGYPDAAPARDEGRADWWWWWRSLRGNAVSAIEADAIRLVRVSDTHLPPIGPKLGDVASDAWFVRGFLPVERESAPAGVWAVGKSAEITFWSDLEGDHALRFEVGPPPPGPGGDAQTITVSLNGHSLGAFDLRPGAVERHVVRTGGALTKGANSVELGFARTSGDLARAAYFRQIELE